MKDLGIVALANLVVDGEIIAKRRALCVVRDREIFRALVAIEYTSGEVRMMIVQMDS